MNTITHRKTLTACLTVSIILAVAVPLLGASKPSGSQSAIPAETKQKLAKLQIPFIANQGQSNKEMKFYARTFAGTVFVTETGKLVYSLPRVGAGQRSGAQRRAYRREGDSGQRRKPSHHQAELF